MDINKISYYVATGLFSAIMLMSAGMYLFNHEMVAQIFTDLGFPTWIIYPLAVAKLLGLVAIWTRKSALLMEWAYAGFFFDVLLASGAHLTVTDGGQWPALGAMVMILISRIMRQKVFSSVYIL